MRIVDPHRAAQLQGHEPHALPVAGDVVQLPGDQTLDAVGARRRTLEHGDAGDVQVRDSVLQVEELRIEHAQSIHAFASIVQRASCDKLRVKYRPVLELCHIFESFA